jgi:hypothetical protein
MSEVRSLIEDRLKDLDDESRRLNKALDDLGGGQPKASGPKPGRPPKRTSVVSAPPQSKRAPRKRTGARASRGQRRDQFLAAAKKSPGARTSVLAKEIGISANQAYTLAGRLLKDGEIKRSGKGYRIKPKAGK